MQIADEKVSFLQYCRQQWQGFNHLFREREGCGKSGLSKLLESTLKRRDLELQIFLKNSKTVSNKMTFIGHREHGNNIRNYNTFIFFWGWNSGGELFWLFNSKPLEVAVSGKLQFLAWSSRVV